MLSAVIFGGMTVTPDSLLSRFPHLGGSVDIGVRDRLRK